MPITLYCDVAQIYEVVNSVEYPDIDDEGDGFIREHIESHAIDAALDNSRALYGSTFSISKAATDNAASLKHVISKGQVCIDLEDPEYIIPRTVSFIPEQIFLVLCVVWVDFNNWVSKTIFSKDSPEPIKDHFIIHALACFRGSLRICSLTPCNTRQKHRRSRLCSCPMRCNSVLVS